jgi:RNA polymerase sigma-70 factor (ECF subfamily)
MATNYERLINAARRLLVSRADAEDAVQDTYVRALVAFSGRPEPQPAWLHTVLRNIAIDRLRRKQLESRHAEVVLPPERSLEAVLEIQSECEAAIRRLLSQISPAEAAAILLRDVFEFDYEEIARMVGKNAGASRQLLHRARMRAQSAGSARDIEEDYVGLYWRAIEARDPAPLVDVLRMTIASLNQGKSAPRQHCGARTSSRLVQVHGRYAIALVLDGVVLCLVPVGTQAALQSEPA